MGGRAGDRSGESFGPYQLKGLLGRGGMAEVYRAWDTVRSRDVALKLIPHRFADDPDLQDRFRRECETLARLGEPHIVPLHDFGEIDSTLYLDMRLVEGQNLRQLMQSGPMDPRRAISLIEQVAAALDSAHVVGLVHRDVKPENILVTQADFVYLIDFGIAYSNDHTGLTKTGTTVGSVAYMSPDQFGEAPVTSVSDVYSLAAVLFELLTGRQPYPGTSVTSVTKQLLFGDIPMASDINPAISRAMSDVLAWGLAKEPDRRCQSAPSLARAARAALADPGADGETSAIGASNYAPTAHGAMPRPAVPTPPLVPRPPVPQPPVTQPPVTQHPVTQPSIPVEYLPHPNPGAPGRRSSSSNQVLIGVLSAVIVLLLGAGAWMLLGGGGDTESTASGPQSTVSETQEVPAQPGNAGVTAAPQELPPGAKPCPGISGLATHEGRKTSCAFALSVRDAYWSSGGPGGSRTVNGWAQQQQASVPMFCGPEYGIVICRGGTQSIVYIY